MAAAASSSSVANLKVDDEIRPTVEALQRETDRLMDIARQVYVPSKVTDTVIGEVLPVPLQLQLYVTSAFVTLTSLFCQRKLANEPIPDKLREQLARVEVYKRKLREHGINIDALGAAATTAAASKNTTSKGAAGSPAGASADRRREREEQQQLPAAASARTKKVDPKALSNVEKLTQTKTKKSME